MALHPGPGPSHKNSVNAQAVNSASYITLVSLIIQGDLEGLLAFLAAQKTHPDVRDENGQTPLMFACLKGELIFVQTLICNGADVNAIDNDNWSCLHHAAKEGHVMVCAALLDSGATKVLEHRDVGKWTPLMWAAYKGHADVVHLLLERGADPNVTGQYGLSCLLWAAGRGHIRIVKELLAHGAKVNSGDKYGTTALVWACRKGYSEIVEVLLRIGANVDTAGMFCWTPLLVATRGNFPNVVTQLLENKPMVNVNATDGDGNNALTIASKEGFVEIAVSLIKSGAYVNLQDRNGDTNLILASKSGHLDIVEALLKKYADVDVQGTDRKTALYWAVEKGHVGVVKALLTADPDMELATKDGDTALTKAVRNRNAEIVQLLLEKKAKVSAADKKGDTALHVAMRARNKALVELLLRNPKHSQLLYRPNKDGETPYNIDAMQPKSILAQIFGARRLNTNEDNENLLGYDLYSSALADILSEPSLSMPICVGLYAKWGSGKSFLLGKLQDEMKNFARQWVQPTFVFSWMSFLSLIGVAIIVMLIAAVASHQWRDGALAGGAAFVLGHVFLSVIRVGCDRYDWQYTYEMSVYLARKMSSLKLFLQVLFCHPPQSGQSTDGPQMQTIKFLFTDQTKVSSTGGDTNVAHMVSSLFNSLEREYGTITTRLCSVFHPKPADNSSWRFRRLCCVPQFVIAILLLVCAVAAVVLLDVISADFTGYSLESVQANPTSTWTPKTPSKNSRAMGRGRHYGDDDDEDDDDDDDEAIHHNNEAIHRNNNFVGAATKALSREEWFACRAILITIFCVLAVALLANGYTLVKMFSSIVMPQKRRVMKFGQRDCSASGGSAKASGHLQPLRSTVQLLSNVVKCLDGFSGNRTRLVVVVDGLDSCEQDKVLHNLDAVHLLFSDPGGPFIILLAIDPHVVIKAIEVNIHRVFRDSSISGHDYLRNIVHLPFYLQNSGLRRVRVAQSTAQRKGAASQMASDDTGLLGRRQSSESAMSIPERLKQARRKGSKKLMVSESVASSMGNLHRVSGAQDLTKVLLMDDYFSDVNPRSMRRLMNVIYVTGRLLKAFNIDFNWYHLASWVNITEQWPYHTSWIILYFERNEESLDDSLSLKSIYERLNEQIPTSKDVEPLLEIDCDKHKFDIFLSFHKASLHVSDMKVFLPFTINLDPYIRKVIREEQQNLEDLVRMDTRIPMAMMQRQTPNTEARLMHRRQGVGVVKEGEQQNTWMYHYPSHMVVPGPATNTTPGQWPAATFGQVQPSTRRTAVSKAMQAQMNNEQRLSEMSVDGVCKLLTSLHGISTSRIDTYKAAIEDNNIHGNVLLVCQLDELKGVMKMAFGDWELFRMAVLGLRDRELNPEKNSEEDYVIASSVPLQTGSSGSGSSRMGSISETRGITRESMNSNKSSIKSSIEPKIAVTRRDSIDPAEGTSRNSQRDRTSPKRHTTQKTLERQVTLEEQMIVGALQSLNEQAGEDAILGRNEESGPPSSVLSPIISDPDEGDVDVLVTRRQVPGLNDVSSCAAETKETDVLYLRSNPVSPSSVNVSRYGLNSPSAMEDGVMGNAMNLHKSTIVLDDEVNVHLRLSRVSSSPESSDFNPRDTEECEDHDEEEDECEDEYHQSPTGPGSVSLVTTRASHKGKMGGKSPVSSCNDSDTENSESAPLVYRSSRYGSRRKAGTSSAAAQGHSNESAVVKTSTDVVLEMTSRGSKRATTKPSLNIDARDFRAPSVASAPNTAARMTQTSPQKTVSVQPAEADLLGMLGGNETIL